jgi:hypothetical protein
VINKAIMWMVHKYLKITLARVTRKHGYTEHEGYHTSMGIVQDPETGKWKRHRLVSKFEDRFDSAHTPLVKEPNG